MVRDFRWLCIWFSIILGVSCRFLDEHNFVGPKPIDELISCVDKIARDFFIRRENVLIISACGSEVAGEMVRLMEPDFAINLASKNSEIDFSPIVDYIVLEDNEVTDAYDAVKSMNLNPRGRYVIVTRNGPEDIEIQAGKFWNAGIPNVIFVKPLNDGNVTVFGYEISSRSQGTSGSRELQVLDRWEGKMTRRHNLFSNKFTNMNKYPLKVGVVRREYLEVDMLLTQDHEEAKILGIGSKMLYVFAEKLNFRVVLCEDDIPGQWDENGTMNGLLGQIVRQEIDVTFAFVLPADMIIRAMDYTGSYRSDEFIFVVKRPGRIASWNSAFKTLSLEFWACLLLVVLASLCLAVGAKKLWRLKILGEYIPIIDVLRVLCTQGAVFPKHSGFRLAFALWMIFSLLMAASYTGSLLDYLSTPNFQTVPNNLEELVNSRLKISGDVALRALLRGTGDPLTSKLSDRLDMKTTYDESWQSIFAEGAVVQTSRTNAIRINWLNRHDESRQLHVIEHVTFSSPLSYWLWKGHPYREPLNRFISLVHCSGLFNKWMSDHDVVPVQKKLQNQHEAVVLTMQHLTSVFLVLVCGYVLGISRFCYELYQARGQQTAA